MKAKLYLETTIVSYLVARPSRDAALAADQKATHVWWNKRLQDFEIYVSDIVLDEASAGDASFAKQRLKVLSDFAVLRATPQSQTLVHELISSGILPAKAAGDAAHIALSAIHNIHFLLTWNCVISPMRKFSGRLNGFVRRKDSVIRWFALRANLWENLNYEKRDSRRNLARERRVGGEI
jgi:hypothetical protein